MLLDDVGATRRIALIGGAGLRARLSCVWLVGN